MSRQRAGWGLTRLLEKVHLGSLKKSKTAGKNKYDPRTATRNGEALRRLLALERLEEKYKRRVRT